MLKVSDSHKRHPTGAKEELITNVVFLLTNLGIGKVWIWQNLGEKFLGIRHSEDIELKMLQGGVKVNRDDLDMYDCHISHCAYLFK